MIEQLDLPILPLIAGGFRNELLHLLAIAVYPRGGDANRSLAHPANLHFADESMGPFPSSLFEGAADPI